MGLLFAWWSLDALLAFIPQNIPRLQDVAIDRSVFGWTALISIATGLIAGIAPALQSSRFNLSDSLKEDGRGSSESRGRKTIARCTRSVRNRARLDVAHQRGTSHQEFSSAAKCRSRIQSRSRFDSPGAANIDEVQREPQIVAFYERLLQRVHTLPAVNSAAISSSLPPDQLGLSDNYSTETQRNLDDDHLPIGSLLFVSPNYFKTLSIALKRGRVFTERDSIDAPRVVIINETWRGALFQIKTRSQRLDKAVRPTHK